MKKISPRKPTVMTMKSELNCCDTTVSHGIPLQSKFYYSCLGLTVSLIEHRSRLSAAAMRNGAGFEFNFVYNEGLYL